MIRRLSGWALLATALFLVPIAGSVAGGAGWLRAPAAPAQYRAPCATPDAQNPVFSDVDQNQLVDTRGQAMVPYGVTLDGLALPHWQATTATDEVLMKGAITAWCTNFIGLQIAPAHLFDEHPFDRQYAKAIVSEVAYAASWDENVLLVVRTGPSSTLSSFVRHIVRIGLFQLSVELR